MRFKDLFQRYIAGEASPEEREIVEREIEKHELINEYLGEDMNLEALKNIDAGEGEAEPKNEEDSRILEEIQRAINKKLRRIALKSTVFVLIILGLIQFGISPLMNLAYYNPQVGKVETQRQLLFDTAVFTELHFAGVVTGHTEAEPLGYGSYNIKIDQWDLFSGNTSRFEGKIERGKLKYMERDFYKYPYLNAFRYGDSRNLNWELTPKQKEIPYDNLKAMPESAVAKVYVSFNKDIPIEELASMIDYEKNKFNFVWFAIRTAPRDIQQFPQLGFEPYGGGIVLEKKGLNDAMYPYLDLAHDENRPHSSEVLKTHFKSLVKYMGDREEFVKLHELDTQLYKGALAYIEENGIKSYGALVMGSAHEIAKLRENPIVDSIIIDNAKLSVHTK